MNIAFDKVYLIASLLSGNAIDVDGFFERMDDFHNWDDYPWVMEFSSRCQAQSQPFVMMHKLLGQ